jgi:hypothetical protein
MRAAILRALPALMFVLFQVVTISLVFSVTISGPLTRCTRKVVEVVTCGCYCKYVAIHPERRFLPAYTNSTSLITTLLAAVG